MNNKTPKMGIVTVFYNAEELLEDFFYSLSIQTFKNFVVIAIDNQSPDNSVESAIKLAQNYNIDLVMIENGENGGVAAGDNIGSKKAIELGCEYVLIANNDIRIKKDDVLEKMVQKADKTEENLIVPKIYFYDTNKFWMVGGGISKWTGRSSHRGEFEEDAGQYDEEIYTEYAPTCFMLVRAKVFKDIGFFDEKYFVYFNDTDFVYRANEKGYKILYMPSISMEHKVSISTGGSESDFYIFYSSRNRLYFIKKNFDLFHKTAALSYYFMTRILKLLSSDSRKRKKLAQSVIAGIKM